MVRPGRGIGPHYSKSWRLTPAGPSCVRRTPPRQRDQKCSLPGTTLPQNEAKRLSNQAEISCELYGAQVS